MQESPILAGYEIPAWATAWNQTQESQENLLFMNVSNRETKYANFSNTFYRFAFNCKN